VLVLTHFFGHIDQAKVFERINRPNGNDRSFQIGRAVERRVSNDPKVRRVDRGIQKRSANKGFDIGLLMKLVTLYELAVWAFVVTASMNEKTMIENTKPQFLMNVKTKSFAMQNRLSAYCDRNVSGSREVAQVMVG
jgi:hypothetical protein